MAYAIEPLRISLEILTNERQIPLGSALRYRQWRHPKKAPNPAVDFGLWIHRDRAMLGQSPSFIFVHIPKTGGNSLQNILRTYSSDQIVATAPHQDGTERFELLNQDYGFMKHSGLSEYKAALPAPIYASAFKFCCMRDPWDRAISFYFSPHRNVSTFDRQDFLDSLNDLTPMRHFMEADRGQATTAIGPNFDFIMRFETLQQDFDRVADHLGFPRQALPHRNASLREPSESYYDQDMVDRVSDIFRQDIELSGYSPPIPKGRHG